MSKKGRMILMIVFLALSVILVVLGIMFLPDTVVTQVGSNPTTMGKIPAIAIPFLMTAVFAIAYYIGNNKRYLIVSAAGLAVFVLVFTVNL